MNLTEYAIKNRAVTYFFLVLLLLGGIGSYFVLGQLEDPVFTVKTGAVVTSYPGASAYEVELEVTDLIEKAIQEMPQLKHLYSFSRPGVSIIKVDIEQKYWADQLPQIWDEMRKKIRDVTPQFPPGAGKPTVVDDFAFVYGFVLGLTGDGFSYKELEDWADAMKKELSLIPGVSRVELWGVQDKVIYLDVSEQQMAERGLTVENFVATLGRQNMVVDAGSIDVQDRRLRVAPTGEFQSPEDIGELFLHPTTLDLLNLGVPTSATGVDALQPSQQASPTVGGGVRPGVELIRIKDIAEVKAGYLEPPRWLMRLDGMPALAIQIAAHDDVNVVEVGKRLEKRIEEILPFIPVGLEITRIAWQSTLVTEAINGFFLNLLGSVVIVLVVLTIPMGWRMGVIIGTGLVLTILGTFMGMAILGYPFQRMSLGALIIAMGMMVDNSIVVADGIQVKINQGMDRVQAAIEAASKPSLPLLGATVIAVMAFYPIFASEADAGEYCRTLFVVVAMSLLISWVLAMTITPVQCLDMLPPAKASEGEEEKDPYDTKFFNVYRGLLVKAIRGRWIFMGCMVALLVASILGFGNVKQMFFPYASRNQLMVDFWFPEGTRIQEVSERVRAAEEELMKNELVQNVSSYFGQGPPRFYLPVDPELPFYQNYAEIIVNTNSYKDVDPVIAEIEPWMEENYPDALTRVRKYGVGPSDTWKFAWHITGPADADLNVLRELGDKAVAILENEPRAKEIKTSLMNRIQKYVPEYDQVRGRWAQVSREDIGFATRRAYDGQQVGLYREGDDLYPIMLRHPPKERLAAADSMEILQVKPELSTNTVPLSQVTKDIRVEWEEPYINRWERRRCITIQATPDWWSTYPDLKRHVIDEFEKLRAEFPPEYDIFMDGEDESQLDAQSSLTPGVMPAVIIMLFIMVALYNAYRQMLIILITIPFAAIGVTFGLLITGQPFGFLAMLGAMSLSGMMIKNAIVLLDTVREEMDAGKTHYEAIVRSGVTRLRPVALAAATTVMALTTLAPDVFWAAMAYTIMFGLTFGTVLTMFVVPVLYCMFYKVKSPETAM
ncbi:MAG: efflux RND transporter permease subunit [Deltaproteobacteria bacterium]|nr:MAG: efflux RND transporter permease subunit [Deltaproteobacteria bacterium]